MIYRFRVILDNDTEEDVFRDFEIREGDNLEDLHNTIAQSFGFDGLEMASFYISDEDWNQGEEISMFDLSETPGSSRIMSETKITSVVHEASPRLIYVYDFFNMWTFFVELASVESKSTEFSYPQLLFSFGVLPESPPEKDFSFETEDNEDDLNMGFDDMESFDDMEADPENWY